MDNEAVATAIARLDTKMDSVLTAINDIKTNCERTETSRSEDIKNLFEKNNKLALQVESHKGQLATHNRYFGYVAAILVGIIIAVGAALAAKGGL
ncbi:MAG: hypothetical protein LUQ71_10295 [Methanoregula sp.]|nr:hypothetical protein [Methanoregula sp.]